MQAHNAPRPQSAPSPNESHIAALRASSRYTCRWAAEERLRLQQAAESDLSQQRPHSGRAPAARRTENRTLQQQRIAADTAAAYPHGAPKGVVRRMEDNNVHEIAQVGFGSVPMAPQRAVRTLRQLV